MSLGRIDLLTNRQYYKKSFDNSEVYRRAKQMRNTPTIAENYMWKMLRKNINNRIPDIYFKRQVPIGTSYILDFYCRPLKFAIEIDGDYHTDSWQKGKDAKRDRILYRKFGIQTLRFTNNEVLNNSLMIINKIENIFNKLMSQK